MKTLFVVFFFLAGMMISSAAEFWMESRKFKFRPGEEIVVGFLTGENFTGETWVVPANKAVNLKRIFLHGSEDLTTSLKPAKTFSIKLVQEGTQLFVAKSNSLTQSWSAEDFNAFLEDQGMDEIVALRRQAGNGNSDVTTINTHLEKMIVQVGAAIDNTFLQKTDLALELVPATNPDGMKPGDYMECQLIYQGKPLPHALVKVWSRINRTTFLQDIYSEKDGTIKFPISNKGAWMVSSIKLNATDQKGVSFSSVSTSLVFGIN